MSTKKSIKIFILITVISILFCSLWALYPTKRRVYYTNKVYELTSPLDQETVQYLCRAFELDEANGKWPCLLDEPIYADDFVGVIQEFTIPENHQGATRTEVDSKLGKYLHKTHYVAHLKRFKSHRLNGVCRTP